MPKSARRKRDGRPVVRRVGAPGKTALVLQQRIVVHLNRLDDLIRAVPEGYDGADLAAAVEHHHHATAVVAYMRQHDILGIFAQLAGGELVPVDPGVTETGQREVTWGRWVATWRQGITAHVADPSAELTTDWDPPAPRKTMCGRFTGNGLWITPADEVELMVTPCRQCAAAMEITPDPIVPGVDGFLRDEVWPGGSIGARSALPTRTPGASTDATGQTVAEYVQTHGRDSIGDLTGPPAIAPRDALERLDAAIEATRARAAARPMAEQCPHCRRTVATKAGGGLYRHLTKPRGPVCPGA